eukprot:50000-Chlamydomonas_euryale.AAC.2
MRRWVGVSDCMTGRADQRGRGAWTGVGVWGGSSGHWGWGRYVSEGLHARGATEGLCYSIQRNVTHPAE